MKNKIFFGAIILCALCMNCCRTHKVPQTSTPKQEVSKIESILEIEDTLNLGTLQRTNTTSVHHLFCKCKGSHDIRIKDIKVSNPSIKITSSPIITAGSKGTILCILETNQIDKGEHSDTIYILTNSSTEPNASSILKYTIVQ